MKRIKNILGILLLIIAGLLLFLIPVQTKFERNYFIILCAIMCCFYAKLNSKKDIKK